MDILRNLLFALGINAVPLVGLSLGHWNVSTALALYWVENLIGALLIAARIAIHQQQTHKRGHFRAHVTTRTTVNGVTRTRVGPSTFGREFLLLSLVFTAAHGFFLFIISALADLRPSLAELLPGVGVVALFQVMGFAADLVTLKYKPFAWVKAQSQYALGRVVLIHIALIAGMFFVAITNSNQAFFVPFAALKLLADVGSVLSTRAHPEQEPATWFVALVNRIKPRPGQQDFATYLQAERERDQREAALDEEVLGG